jgi:hypothetical protein
MIPVIGIKGSRGWLLLQSNETFVSATELRISIYVAPACSYVTCRGWG